MNMLASAGSRYTTSQGSYKQLTWNVVISRKMETMRMSPVKRPLTVGGCRKSG